MSSALGEPAAGARRLLGHLGKRKRRFRLEVTVTEVANVPEALRGAEVVFVLRETSRLTVSLPQADADAPVNLLK